MANFSYGYGAKNSKGGGKGGNKSSEDSTSGGRKVFVGGIPTHTSEEGLREFCSQFGEVEDVRIMIDRNTGGCRGFAFVTFSSTATVNFLCAEGKNFQDFEGKQIEFKNAAAKERSTIGAPPPGRPAASGSNWGAPTPTVEPTKVFVGGLPESVTNETLSNYFSQFGTVKDATVMTDKNTGLSRGFAFLTMSSEPEVEAIFAAFESHTIDGKWVEVKACQAKGSNPGKGGKGGGSWGPSGGKGYGKGKGGGNSYGSSSYNSYGNSYDYGNSYGKGGGGSGYDNFGSGSYSHPGYGGGSSGGPPPSGGGPGYPPHHASNGTNGYSDHGYKGYSQGPPHSGYDGPPGGYGGYNGGPPGGYNSGPSGGYNSGPSGGYGGGGPPGGYERRGGHSDGGYGGSGGGPSGGYSGGPSGGYSGGPSGRYIPGERYEGPPPSGSGHGGTRNGSGSGGGYSSYYNQNQQRPTPY